LIAASVGVGDRDPSTAVVSCAVRARTILAQDDNFVWWRLLRLAGAGQDQGYVVGLFVVADPVVDGLRHDLADLRERQLAILAD